MATQRTRNSAESTQVSVHPSSIPVSVPVPGVSTPLVDGVAVVAVERLLLGSLYVMSYDDALVSSTTAVWTIGVGSPRSAVSSKPAESQVQAFFVVFLPSVAVTAPRPRRTPHRRAPLA